MHRQETASLPLGYGRRVAVGIPTAGRRDTLSETLKQLAAQQRLPDRVILCPAVPNDVDSLVLSALPFATEVVAAPSKGSASQRNAILAAAFDIDIIVFLDDDFFPAVNYLTNVETLFANTNDIVLATGKLIEDGIHGPGLGIDYSRRKLAETPLPPVDGALLPYYGVYGCNMAVRLSTARAHSITFDERLPLYSWQEDIDFSRQMAPFGRIIQAESLTGIHLGVKSARGSGVRLGYSQIANPAYLIRKGTMSIRFGARTVLKNLAANLLRSFRPEPHVDRIGRLRGNLMALADFLRGTLRPERVLELEDLPNMRRAKR